MKKLAISVVIAILIAGQLFSLAAAAAPSSGAASTNCGNTYTVQRGDWLARIARNCGTTVASILAHNPQIYNPNWIYAGEVLTLTGTVNAQPVVYYNPNVWYGGYYYPGNWWYPGYYNPPSTSTTTARVSLSTTRAKAGNSVTVTVSGFPANADIDYRVGQQGETYTTVYDGKTGSNGATSRTITIPSSASKGEYWVVHVMTTEVKQGVQVYSSLIYITG